MRAAQISELAEVPDRSTELFTALLGSRSAGSREADSREIAADDRSDLLDFVHHAANCSG